MLPSMKTLFVTLSLLLSLSVSLAEEKAKKPRRDGYWVSRIAELKPDETLIYKEVDGRELEYHIFKPEGWKASDKRPCFHIIHGGGWQGMDPSRMFPFAADFAKRFGMVAVCPQYRLYKPDKSVTVFDCVKDARSSVRYTRAHAAELGIDPDKIVVSGASAGGHLAVSTALFDDVNEETDDMAVPCLPNALILYFPVIDTSPEGYGQKKIGEEWKELSPAHNVRKGVPPTLTFHGTGDNTCPFKGAKLFHEEMLEAENVSQLEVTEGGGHGYLIFDKDIYLDSLDKAEKFLKANGILEK